MFFVIVLDQNVFQLQVPMHDVKIVYLLQGVCYLFKHLLTILKMVLGRLVPVFPHYPIKQVPSFKVLKHQSEFDLVLIHIVEFDNIRALPHTSQRFSHYLQDLDLFLHKEEFLGVHLFFLNLFECHQSTCDQISCLKDLTKGSLSQKCLLFTSLLLISRRINLLLYFPESFPLD